LRHQRLLNGSTRTIYLGIILYVVGSIVAGFGIQVYTYMGPGILTTIYTETIVYDVGIVLVFSGIVAVIVGVSGIIVSVVLEFFERKRVQQPTLHVPTPSTTNS